MEFCIPDELFRLPRISLILDALTNPLSLKPLELGPRPRTGEIITMHTHHDAPLGMHKHTRG
jgi:hypothetical protein